MFLFVYGTLKSGHRNNHYLDNATFVGEFETSPHYRLFDNGCYPMMIEADRDGYRVSGEIWEVDDDEIGIIDDHEAFYLRKPIDVPDFDEFCVWSYIYARELLGCVECYGMWG